MDKRKKRKKKGEKKKNREKTGEKEMKKGEKVAILRLFKLKLRHENS